MARPRTRPRRPARRPLAAAVVLGVFASLTAGAAPAVAAPAEPGTVEPGTGSASAISAAITPKAGGLGVGVGFGQAAAQHTGTSSQATAQAVDFGVIKTVLTTSLDGNPPTLPPDTLPSPLSVDSHRPDAETGLSRDESGFTDAVRATDRPLAEATSTSAPVDIPGVGTIGGSVAHSFSGIVDGRRQAGATVTISNLTLPGGISLAGMRWQARYDSSRPASEGVRGAFSVSSASIGGTALPATDISSTLSAVNDVLTPLGLQLSAPAPRMVRDSLVVAPLRLSYVPNATRDAVLGEALGSTQPIRQPLIDAILDQSSEAGKLVTVADVVVTVLAGGGSFDLDLGGVQASSGEVQGSPFDLGLRPGAATPAAPDGSGSPPRSPLPDNPQPGGPAPGGPAPGGPLPGSPAGSAASSPGLPAAGALTTPAPSGTADRGAPAPSSAGPRADDVRAAAPAGVAKSIDTSRGGLLALVALGVLGLTALLAIADGRVIVRTG